MGRSASFTLRCSALKKQESTSSSMLAPAVLASPQASGFSSEMSRPSTSAATASPAPSLPASASVAGKILEGLNPAFGADLSPIAHRASG